MTDDPTVPRPFWTFSARDIHLGVSGLSVTGWFIWCRIDNLAPEGEQEHLGLKIHYLTPFDEPVTFVLPPTLIRKQLDAITARDVVTALTALFSDAPFQAVPAAPADLPLHKIPPSRRAAIQAALRNRSSRTS